MVTPEGEARRFADRPEAGKAERDGLRHAGDGSRDAGTNGRKSVTDGRVLPIGLVLVAAFVSALATVNVLSNLADRPGLDPWIPVTDEGASVVAMIVVAWIPWLADREAPLLRQAPGWRLLLHVPALLAFSAGHVALMLVLRELVFALHGESYRFGPIGQGFVYELRKDALIYALAVGAFEAVRLQLQPAPVRPEGPATFDIVDGARVLRVPVDQILAVTSARNYVEFQLADGRQPLMRRPLSAVARQLPAGFVQVHRSWIVNGRRVTGLTPQRSGDYQVEVGPLKVPLSRRYPQALAQLRSLRPDPGP